MICTRCHSEIVGKVWLRGTCADCAVIVAAERRAEALQQFNRGYELRQAHRTVPLEQPVQKYEAHAAIKVCLLNILDEGECASLIQRELRVSRGQVERIFRDSGINLPKYRSNDRPSRNDGTIPEWRVRELQELSLSE